METQESPLKKYRRQPKIYIELPSKGKFSPPNTLANDTWTDLAVFSMTASDEIGFKTPDALINGESTASSIKSCIPSVLNPWAVPTIDIDVILIAMRIASYGPGMNVISKCPYCKHENAYNVELQPYLDHYNRLTYDNSFVMDGFKFFVRPLSYKEWTDFQKRTIAIQRAMTLNAPKIADEDEKNKFIDQCIVNIQDITAEMILTAVDAIEVDNILEKNKKEIIEFLTQNDLVYFKAIKDHLEKIGETWMLPSRDVACEQCEKEHKIRLSLDQADFFATG